MKLLLKKPSLYLLVALAGFVAAVVSMTTEETPSWQAVSGFAVMGVALLIAALLPDWRKLMSDMRPSGINRSRKR